MVPINGHGFYTAELKVQLIGRSTVALEWISTYRVLSREKDGRRNRYAIDLTVALRHPLEAGVTVGDLLAKVVD